MPITSALLSPELLVQLEKMELVSRKVFRGRMKGERRSPRKGQSVEFADFRNYVPGDDLRFVDWNTYARLEKLFLKMFLEEEDLHFYALIDASTSMDFGEPTKLRYALQLAAALGFIGLVRGDRVKIETLGSPGGQASPVFRGRRSLWRMLEHLESIQARPKRFADRRDQKFLPSQLGQGHRAFNQRLDGQKWFPGRIAIFGLERHGHLRCPTPIGRGTGPGRQRRSALVDCEDDDVAEVTVTGPLLKRYKQTLAAFVDSAKEFCTRRGMAYLLARTSIPVDQLVTGYLATRGLVR